MTEDASASDEVGGIDRKCSPDGGIVATTPYSMSPRSQKRWITFIVGVAMMFSPLSANIYLPSLPLLQRDVHTNPQLINLTVTAYVILQGIAPAFFGELSDKVGRHLVYVISFGIYVAANTGLARNPEPLCCLVSSSNVAEPGGLCDRCYRLWRCCGHILLSKEGGFWGLPWLVSKFTKINYRLSCNSLSELT
jgi:MFS family permease